MSAKLGSVTVDLDALLAGEVPTEEEIKHEVVERLFSALIREIREDIIREVKAQVRASIEAEISGILTKPFQPTDRYGNAVGNEKTTTLAEVIVATSRDYLQERVNNHGEKAYDGPTRIKWMASQAAREAVEKDLKPVINEAKAEVTALIKARLATLFAETVTSALKPV